MYFTEEELNNPTLRNGLQLKRKDNVQQEGITNLMLAAKDFYQAWDSQAGPSIDREISMDNAEQLFQHMGGCQQTNLEAFCSCLSFLSLLKGTFHFVLADKVDNSAAETDENVKEMKLAYTRFFQTLREIQIQQLHFKYKGVATNFSSISLVHDDNHSIHSANLLPLLAKMKDLVPKNAENALFHYHLATTYPLVKARAEFSYHREDVPNHWLLKSATKAVVAASRGVLGSLYGNVEKKYEKKPLMQDCALLSAHALILFSQQEAEQQELVRLINQANFGREVCYQLKAICGSSHAPHLCIEDKTISSLKDTKRIELEAKLAAEEHEEEQDETLSSHEKPDEVISEQERESSMPRLSGLQQGRFIKSPKKKETKEVVIGNDGQMAATASSVTGESSLKI